MAPGADSSAWGWVGTRGLTHTCGEGVSVGQTHPAAPGGGVGMGSALLCSARPHQLSPGCINSVSYKSALQPSRRAGQAACPPRDINNCAVCSVTMARPTAPCAPRCNGTGGADTAPQRGSMAERRPAAPSVPTLRLQPAGPAALVRRPTAVPHISPHAVTADAPHGAPHGRPRSPTRGALLGTFGARGHERHWAQTRAEGGSFQSSKRGN